jgi:DNA end-binding protein Ku
VPTAVWTGSISFGLVSIPVRLFPATSPKDPRFRQIDRRTGRRVRYRRVVEEEPEATAVPSEPPEPEPASAPTPEAPSEPPETRDFPDRVEREVPYADIVKGYEVEEGRHVILEPEEVEELRPERSRAIDIEHFVALDSIDPVYFEKSYHLAPRDESAAKPYGLLRMAMEEAGRVAIGRFVLRTREHLVAIRPTRGILGLETLFFADEVRAPAAGWLLAPVEEGSPAEVEMAGRLIEIMAADWDPALYRDTYRERVLDLVGQREPSAVEEAEAGPPVADLMAALKASVDALGEAKAKPSKRGRKASGSGGR